MFVAVKFFMPLSQVQSNPAAASEGITLDTLKEIEGFFSREIGCLSKMSHPGIVKIIDRGKYQPSTDELTAPWNTLKELNFFVMEYIDGHDISEYIKKKKPSTGEIARLFAQVCNSLVYLHATKKYLHADLRAENILVRKDSLEPVIIDFALYKNFNFAETDPDGITKLWGDWDLFPKDLPTHHPLKRAKETQATRQKMMSLCFPALDLFQIGKLLERVREHCLEKFSAEELAYWDLLTKTLTGWESVKSLDSGWLAQQFPKLNPVYSQFMGVEELTPPSSAHKTRQLPEAVITLSPLIDRLINTGSFRRLSAINQLALIGVIYDGASHRRHLHCLRAYGYCAELLKSLMHSPDFRLLFDPLLARQALVVSLLHDINHFPFLHVFQEAPPELTEGIDLIDLFCDGSATSDQPSIYEMLESEVGLTQDQFKKILTIKHHELVGEGFSPGLQIIKSMIDSGADVDKLAYLEYDSFFTGVPYGKGIDSGRLIESATVVRIPNSDNPASRGWHLGYHEHGLPAVESLVMTRYWMFLRVYWHSVNRSVMSMLSHDIRNVLKSAADVKKFIKNTMWESEERVLQRLNTLYKGLFGRDHNSVTHKLLKNPSDTIYQELISIQGGGAHSGEAASGSMDESEYSLYETISNMSNAQLDGYLQNLCTELRAYLKSTFGVKQAVTPDDLLIDKPGRRFDRADPIYIQMKNGQVRPVAEVSESVKNVIRDFQVLAKRLRVYIHPRLISNISPARLVEVRPNLLRIMRVPSTDSKNQTK